MLRNLLCLGAPGVVLALASACGGGSDGGATGPDGTVHRHAAVNVVVLDPVSRREAAFRCDSQVREVHMQPAVVAYRTPLMGWQYDSVWSLDGVELGLLDELPVEGEVRLDLSPCFEPVVVPLMPLLQVMRQNASPPRLDTLVLRRALPRVEDVRWLTEPLEPGSARWTIRAHVRIGEGGAAGAVPETWVELSSCIAWIGQGSFAVPTCVTWERRRLEREAWTAGPVEAGVMPVTIVQVMPHGVLDLLGDRTIAWSMRGAGTGAKVLYCTPEFGSGTAANCVY